MGSRAVPEETTEAGAAFDAVSLAEGFACGAVQPEKYQRTRHATGERSRVSSGLLQRLIST